MEISALTNIAIGPAKVPILLNAPDSLPTEPDALPAAEAIPLIASPVAEAAEAALSEAIAEGQAMNDQLAADCDTEAQDAADFFEIVEA